MKIVDYTQPKLYKDSENKKWNLYYKVKYEGQEKWTPQKEYGKNYTLDRKSLNSIADLKKRETEFIKVMGALEHHLKAGVSIKVPETVKVAVEERIKETKKLALDENLKLFLRLKGYDKPILYVMEMLTT
ncbi:hypothetical protein DYU05_20095 [Mucilaginibacter terrenus]|uniref:Arm DNA-binding domain-containing protein n=1 Tax=Mucilaginibacter terrenus TaxID=2482727 RepID=A0A3E2NJ82_9SPHI|nr:hypothetical protein [Mucilaginibacter terrenus]RFZ81064.1 hypothetical protein DYU05_20095 [Mucilaginibacter terrenus]